MRRAKHPPGRTWLKWLVLCAIAILACACTRDSEPLRIDFSKTIAVTRPDVQAQHKPVLRVAVGAMISPKATFGYYQRLLDYLGERMGYKVDLVQRKTYQEINQLIAKERIDLAFICSGPYATGRDRYGFKLVAAPQIHGDHSYRSYLIVHRDSPYHRLQDLQGKVFAFTDPESLSGRLVPAYWVAQLGHRPEDFFSQVIYTFSHDNSILAVARGVVDGAAVDGLVWDYIRQRKPELTARTRLIKQSQPFGIPPIVASGGVPAETVQAIRQLLLSMHEDAAGKKILEQLMIERFVIPHESWYESIRLLENEISPHPGGPSEIHDS